MKNILSAFILFMSVTVMAQNSPGMPAAEIVEKEGLDLADNQALLLKKVEELTLYAIAQQKEIESLKKDIVNLKKKKGPKKKNQ